MKHTIERFGDVVETWTAVMRLVDDAQWVLTMRLLGLSGGWSMPEDERDAMIREKLPAFTEAALSGTFAAMSGRSPAHVVRETLEPISSKASANRARLQDSGPRLFGRGITPN
jgi:hypothetical protein